MNKANTSPKYNGGAKDDWQVWQSILENGIKKEYLTQAAQSPASIYSSPTCLCEHLGGV